MTKSSGQPDLDFLLGRVRGLTEDYKKGNKKSLEAFTELATLILDLTVAHPSSRLTRYSGESGEKESIYLSASPKLGTPLRLSDGSFLRVGISLALRPAEKAPTGKYAKVVSSSCQYQLDKAGKEWLWRYDYVREPEGKPAAHFQVRADLKSDGTRLTRKVLERVHFPTGRVSLEAIVRLLIEEFGVPAATDPLIWQPVLALSEDLFLKIAHLPRQEASASESPKKGTADSAKGKKRASQKRDR